ncbi:Ig domain-containing protein [Streptomyces sp. NPDC048483]|uniref:Ig domain-containing protein n=1 Tax=Streptomyces sp. NPDC048483 TaxID=3154927 RepID=UPI00341AC090
MSANPGSAQTLAIEPAGGTGQHAGPYQTFAHPLKARLVDIRTGTAIADSTVTFSWDSTTQQALFEGDERTVTAQTDAKGYAQTPPVVAGDAAGTATFVVTAEGAAPEQFEVTVDD